MKRELSAFILLIIGLCTQLAHPQVFKCQNQNNSISYQETPCLSNEKELSLKSQHKKGTSSQPPTQEQKRYCESSGKLAEAVVDLYISGTTKKEALELLKKAASKSGKGQNLIEQIVNFVYDDLKKIGGNHNQSTRAATKEIMNQQAVLNCLTSPSVN